MDLSLAVLWLHMLSSKTLKQESSIQKRVNGMISIMKYQLLGGEQIQMEKNIGLEETHGEHIGEIMVSSSSKCTQIT